MLTTFKAALQRGARLRHFDEWASIAADLADGAHVLILSAARPAEVYAYSGDPQELTEEAIDAASTLEPTVPGRYAADHAFTGSPTGLPAPFCRAVSILITHEQIEVLCVFFPAEGGIRQTRLKRMGQIGERRLAEIALLERYRADLKRFIGMFNQMERTANIGLWEVDLSRRTVRSSDEVKRVFELPPQGTMPVTKVLRYFPRPARRELLSTLAATRRSGRSRSLALPIDTARGNKRTVRVFVSRQYTNEGAVELAGVLQDVTEQHLATERLWWTANHDPLTELPNRALFADRFRTALERHKRSRRPVCMVLIDVDKFKDINDTFGHAAGDDLLRCVANQLRQSVRAHDTVARTGGDEFSILLEDVQSREALECVFRRLRQSLKVRFSWQAHTVDVALSAGAALAPDHGATERDLIARADLALYRMKAECGPALSLYDVSFGRAAEARSRMVEEARVALRDGQIVPYYQPQLDVASGRIVGVEALARWVKGDVVLTAAQFQDALADHEIGPMIGEAVVDMALIDMARLNRGRSAKIALSINASSGELFRAKFIERIGAICEDTGELGPVTVEIKEDVILDDLNGRLAEAMRSAEENGVSFALDSFGTGYGSFVHITSLPISEVKVNRRFVAGLGEDEQKGKIMRGILHVARSLGIRVVLEGVETPDQAAQIVEAGGRFAQGFYYAKALPFCELAALIDGQEKVRAAA